MPHEGVQVAPDGVKVPHEGLPHMGYNAFMNTTFETSVVSSSPDIMSGAVVFAGTRVPAQSLLDYLAGGHTLEEFLDDFPTVAREQSVQLLHELGQSFDMALDK